MRIDLIEDYDKNFPSEKIIRLYDFTRQELKNFKITIYTLINNSKELFIDEISYVVSSSIKLTLKVSQEDLGIMKIESNLFKCELTTSGYKEMIERIEGLEKAKDLNFSFQWLYDLNSNIEFLLSKSGTW